MVRKVLITVVLLSVLGLSGFASAENVCEAENLIPIELRCENMQNPLSVGGKQPRLCWKLKSSVRSQRQTAYQILVVSSMENLNKDKGDLWDSKKVTSNETLRISYRGRSLKSSQQVFWKVRVWDKYGNVSAWSEPVSWTMGLLKKKDWKAKY